MSEKYPLTECEVHACLMSAELFIQHKKPDTREVLLVSGDLSTIYPPGAVAKLRGYTFGFNAAGILMTTNKPDDTEDHLIFDDIANALAQGGASWIVGWAHMTPQAFKEAMLAYKEIVKRKGKRKHVTNTQGG